MKTIAPVEPGNFENVRPEFGRTKDVERTRGLKRGTLYNLLLQGKIRGYLLRVQGEKSGVRLWDLASIDDFIRSNGVYASKSGPATCQCDMAASYQNCQVDHTFTELTPTKIHQSGLSDRSFAVF